ncbi:haloacid dehalogenase [Actinoplanes lobatus]|uniref:Haloacid dehalogenase n=1 Tax=Actinoplanes lobatus TaxID=113568 RepID=A0A7W7MKC7_9ACTN|nr:HAD-IA family hydrolase [Actinoplanes lobatus]MBB4753514.1 sugar-phosphatase [Actinoplanes lobatus]GGN91723.1 haloacid dehalogenase [Actinoplanes lobatus]GIE38047.1 haloacid dehalogenase [Actinoplanes lobatus]
MAHVPMLFDIDGTLIDSRLVVEEAWRDVAARFGADANAILRTCHGRRDEDVVADFFPPDVHAAVVGRIAAVEQDRAADVVAMPGARRLLTGLPHGTWAAVTSGSRRLMTARLEGAGLPVPEVLIAAEDVRFGKPHPEGYLAAAGLLGADIGRCVVVEDSPTGVAAGRAAGAFVVGLGPDPSGLTGADVVVGSLAEVVHAVRERR